MPDWNQLVRYRMGDLRLSPECREDVISELASHMEDEYDAALSHGMTPEQAQARVLRQVTDWRRLRRKLQSSKEDPMTDRVKQVLIPGMITLGVSALAQLAVFAARETFYAAGIPTPSVYWVRGSLGLVINYPWLVLLPFFGACAACWARRAGGSMGSRLLAATFPALVIGALLIVALLLSPFIDRHVPLGMKLFYSGVYFLGWVIIPGAALMLGALPFLRQPTERSLQTLVASR